MKKVYVGKNAFGKGLFSIRDVAKAEVLGILSGKVYSWQESDQGLEDNFFMQIDWDKWLYVRAPERYLNHSCQPNAKIKNRKLVALKKISKNTEITIDYDTIDYWNKMKCYCKAKNCRKVIRGYSSLALKMRKRLEGVSDYLLERHDKIKNNLYK